MTDGEKIEPTDEVEATGFDAPDNTDKPEKAKEPDPVEEEGGDEADEPNPEVNDEADEPEDEDKPEKGRSKPAKQRIAELTAARREAERRAAELEQRIANMEAGKPEDGRALEKPDPADEKYQFGEADPQYLADLTEWKVETRLAERDAERAIELQRERAAQVGQTLDAQWAEKAEKAAEKYEDFQETVIEGAANGDWPLLPLSAAAVQGSEVGDDVAYHLATNKADAKKLASLEQQFHETRMLALKEGLSPDLALMFAKPHLDRATEFFEALEAKAKKRPEKQAKTVTDAPEPPKDRARGGSVKSTPDWGSENADLDALGKML